MKKGDTDGVISQYNVDRKTGVARNCSHDGYCYPASLRIGGKKIEARYDPSKTVVASKAKAVAMCARIDRINNEAMIELGEAEDRRIARIMAYLGIRREHREIAAGQYSLAF